MTYSAGILYTAAPPNKPGQTRMDKISQAWCEIKFENAFLKKKGNEFQDFFSSIMEKCHPADFQRVCPWGKSGDKKNDGYLKSEKNLFQVYAPNELKSSAAVTKIKKDFHGALTFWKSHISRWTFVHNSVKGLGPDVLEILIQLGIDNPQILIQHWGFEELRKKVFSLQMQDISALLGSAPTKTDLTKVGFEDLQCVLAGIGQQAHVDDSEVRPVPPGKLAANALSNDVKTLLKAGMAKATLVGRFFDEWHDPTLGDRVADKFRREYADLKSKSMVPDQIFSNLFSFAGGGERGTPTQEIAVLAVLAHLFEECDIFEKPPTT